ACRFLSFANPGVGAAAVVRDRAGRILLVQRGAGHFGAGAWCIPCGYVEWGEDVRAAAAREAREEAGIRVAIGDVLQVASNFHEPAKPTIGVWFRATLVDAAAMPGASARSTSVKPLCVPPTIFTRNAGGASAAKNGAATVSKGTVRSADPPITTTARRGGTPASRIASTAVASGASPTTAANPASA